MLLAVKQLIIVCHTGVKAMLSIAEQIPPPQPKNPTRESWIFSFVPIGTTSFAWHTQHRFERSENIIAVCAQMNEVEALPQMMLQQVANDDGFA